MESISKKELNKPGVLNDLLDFELKKQSKGLALPSRPIEDIVKNLESEQPILERYRQVQHVQLTQIQKKLLDAMTEDKMEAASLSELTRAYTLLKDKELVMNGKATAITGIVGYLIALEKEELEGKTKCIEVGSMEFEAEFSTSDDDSFELGSESTEL